jgi:hypothetical protein
MNRLLNVLAVLTLSVTLSGCGGGSSAPATPVNVVVPVAPSTTPTPPASSGQTGTPALNPPNGFAAQISPPGGQVFTVPNIPASVQFTTNIPGSVTWTQKQERDALGNLLPDAGVLDYKGEFSTIAQNGNSPYPYASLITATSVSNPTVSVTTYVILRSN